MIGFIFFATSIYAIIGGPSVGKTSIIEELKAKGKKTIEEAATVIIKQNLKKGIKCPWEKDGFQASIFKLQLELEKKAFSSSEEDYFVDRGILDNLVYLEINERKNTKEYKTIKTKIYSLNVDSRYEAVFYIEPYSKDSFKTSKSEIRHEDTKQALKISKAIKDAYSKYYNLIIIPGNLTAKQRADLIQTKIKNLKTKKLLK